MKDHHRSDIHVFASNASSRTKNKAISITPGNDCKLLKRAKNLSMLVKGSIEKHPHPIIIDDDDDDIVVVERFSSRKKRKPWISEQAGNCESSSGLKWEERINDDEDPIIIIEEKGNVCEICAESKPQNESFRIKGCLHSYCSDCMSSYVTSKLENGVSQINCPVPGCCYCGTLDPEHCKEILPFEVFVRWGQLLCESSIPASQKFYCPFKDCSALLLSDATETVTSSECPFCFRLFCAQCRAGWHEGITCAEYQALDEDEREGKDIMLNNLAKSSNWKRCPYCKIYVEKVTGCYKISCRSLIGIDGTFLKGNYGGVLLSAVALDGNNEMFPIAWAIVSSEDDECWRFFIHHLKSVLQQGNRGDKWCLISDRHKSIEKACRQLWPEVDRRYCCKHLSVNFKAAFLGPKMWQLFWLAASATSPFVFGKVMKQIDKDKPSARVWLANIGERRRWTKHQFDPEIKCDVNNTNFVESFNSTLGADRARPVTTLLEGIRRITMVRMATRRELFLKWKRQVICPNIVKRVQFLCSESRLCLAYPSSFGEFEIIDGKSTLPVSLNHHTCKCNAWQISGVPCKHGMRAILYSNLDPLTFVNEWHSVRTYKMAYGFGINAVPDKEQWGPTKMPTIEPPAMKRRQSKTGKEEKRNKEKEKEARQ